ncbi:hypothetical protein M501DRAFT_1004022 [Patellaria atrata CBS 101060]|uniref:Uncharacterized protein n=1 Tax=Patellaria atrata CBS 101060 TaxID=1346257 RepID=A0A9P4VN69_9PEZI|nr:hypothetical protein M501DRAFT_1004022 [Patellaria atrata CBS 101060]
MFRDFIDPEERNHLRKANGADQPSDLFVAIDRTFYVEGLNRYLADKALTKGFSLPSLQWLLP